MIFRKLINVLPMEVWKNTPSKVGNISKNFRLVPGLPYRPIFSWMIIKSMSRLGLPAQDSNWVEWVSQFYRKIRHKAELRTTKALTSQLQWMPTNYVHPCYSNWKLPKATALWNRKSYPIFCWSRRWKLHILYGKQN